MIVPTSRTRNVRIAPDAASWRDFGFPDVAEMALSDLSGAALTGIERSLMLVHSVRGLAAAPHKCSRSGLQIVTIAGARRSTDRKRLAFELSQAISRRAMR